MPAVFFNGSREQEWGVIQSLKAEFWCWAKYKPIVSRMGVGGRVGCSVWNTKFEVSPAWLAWLEMMDVRHAVGPPVRRPEDWDRLRTLYRDTSVRVAGATVVRVSDPLAISKVPLDYAISPDLSVRFDPWACIGRRVWLRGNIQQRDVWEKYCELRVVGVQVDAVLLWDLTPCHIGKFVCGGDLRFHPVKGWWGVDRLTYSMRRLRDFWEAATKLYG